MVVVRLLGPYPVMIGYPGCILPVSLRFLKTAQWPGGMARRFLLFMNATTGVGVLVKIAPLVALGRRTSKTSPFPKVP